jgi:hypothetical protein
MLAETLAAAGARPLRAGWTTVGVDPADQLLMGPALAMPLALERAGLSLAAVGPAELPSSPRDSTAAISTHERNSPMKVGRNDPCHCGSGQKYKKCHLLKDEAAHAAELAAQRAAQVEPAADAPEADAPADAPAPSASAARAAAPARTPNATVRAKAQAMRQPGAARRRAV